MKKLKAMFFILLLIPTLVLFCSCDENITDFRIENYKTQFDLYEDFTLGNNVIIQKKVGENWKNAKLEEVEIVSSNYNNYEVGTYQIVIKLTDFKKTVTLQVYVNKIISTFEECEKLYATYGQTLSDIELPQGYVWEDETLSVGDVTGNNGRGFNVLFTKSHNYLPVKGTVFVVVERQTPQFEPIESLQAQYLQRLSELSLPQGYTWEDPNLYVGDYTTEGNDFNVIYSKGSNYNNVTGTVKVKVSKISPTVNPVFENEILYYGDEMPTLSLSKSDTKGTIVWQTGQSLTVGSNYYTWQYTPDSPNYFTASGQIRLNVSRQKVKIPTPAALVYTGEEQTVLFNYDSTLWTVTGTVSATEVGNYQIIITLVNTTNYEWENGFDISLQKTWSIISK